MNKMLRFKEYYKDVIYNELKADYQNIMEIPKIVSINLNMCEKKAVLDSKKITSAVSDLTLIAGQKAVITKAKKSIATFKLRENMPIGCKVTLRKSKAYDFLERLVYITLPRLRDFRGFNSKSFDGNGNFSFGIKEHTIFPEIEYDKIDEVRGLNITIVTSAKNDQEAKKLLKALKLPFIKDKKD